MKVWLNCLMVAAICAGGISCGGSSSSSSNAPNLVGGWAGTIKINAVAGHLIGSNTCTHSWTITSQTAATFSGTYQLAGGTTTSCGSSGSVSGTISTTGAFSGLSFVCTVGDCYLPCTLTGSTPWAGNLTGSSINLQRSQQFSCSGTYAARSMVIALTKR